MVKMVKRIALTLLCNLSLWSHQPSWVLNNTQLAYELYQKSTVKERKKLLDDMITAGFFAKKVDKSCIFYDLNKREHKGRFYLEIIDHFDLPAVNDKIFRDLYVELPESVELNYYGHDLKFISWQKKLILNDFIERINNLLVFGRNNEAKDTILFAQKVLKTEPESLCELKYQDAKIMRKMRQYTKARLLFQELSNTCHPEVVIKARYMDLQLAAMMKDVSVLDSFNKFVHDYPEHGFSDDILLFKAKLQLDTHDQLGALSSLEDLKRQFPHGDMINNALFLKAFTLLRLGRVAEALVELDLQKKNSLPGSLFYQQAEYWLLRMAIYNDLLRLDNPNRDHLVKLKQRLNHLALTYSSVYSWLAWQLAKNLGIAEKLPQKKVALDQIITNRYQDLNLIDQLIDKDLKHEAMAILDEQELRPNDSGHAQMMAQLYLKLGRPELGYQKLLRCHEKINNNLAQSAPELYHRLAWPRPFAAELAYATAHADVPPDLIYAIMREESGFMPGAHSWAQARGLMQMMKASADEQARRLGLKSIFTEDLHNPRINMLLGSTLIQYYWQQFGHIAIGVSAYNAGPSSARSWLKSNNGAPLDSYLESISFPETNRYTKSVLGSLFAYTRSRGLSAIPELSLIVP